MASSGDVRLRNLFERVQSSLWFLPTVAVVGAIAGAVALTRVTVPGKSVLEGVVFSGGADGARGMLQAIASSVITVTSLVFTMTVVTLQLASSQFSPRLLRSFLRDRGNQVVLSLFLATFAYSLTVLRTIRAAEDGTSGFIPQVAVTGAFVLTMASVAALVYFIHHITQEIRVDTMMRDVEHQTQRTIRHVYPDAVDAGEPLEAAPTPPRDAAWLPAPTSGFIQDVAVDTLAQVAVAHGVVLRLHAAVGHPVTKGAPGLWLWRDDGTAPPPDVTDDVAAVARRSVQIGHERTEQRDVGFGLRQLVDIAAKALSPGVNDPTTAVHAITHLAALLGELSRRQLDALVRRDGAGVVRVAVQRPTFAGYLDSACGQIRRYGASEPAVVIALLEMLDGVAASASHDAVRDAIRDQAVLVVAAAERETQEPRDLAAVRAAATAVERALDGDLRP